MATISPIETPATISHGETRRRLRKAEAAGLGALAVCRQTVEPLVPHIRAGVLSILAAEFVGQWSGENRAMVFQTFVTQLHKALAALDADNAPPPDAAA